jgi:hypothetical protein
MNYKSEKEFQDCGLLGIKFEFKKFSVQYKPCPFPKQKTIRLEKDKIKKILHRRINQLYGDGLKYFQMVKKDYRNGKIKFH